MAETEETARSSRFTAWVSFLVFSTITLGSSVEVVKDNNRENQTASYERWAVACSSITFAITVIVVVMHVMASLSVYIVGTRLEGGICLVLVAFWAASVAIISDSSHGLAVDVNGAVSNGNLYYFSWAGFVCSINLLVSYLRSAFNVDVMGEIKLRSARLNMWAAHLSTSIVVMGSSANIYDNICTVEGHPGEYCNRTLFGLVLGTISTFFALYIVGMKIATAKAPFLAEALLSFCLTVAYAFGVAFITSHEGPGAPLGNLYYFSWASFLTAFMLAASCVEDYQAAKAMTDESTIDVPPNTGEIQIEDLDQQI